MNIHKINETEKLALELLNALRKVKEDYDHSSEQSIYFMKGNKLTGALRRKSMDLSRVLADLRRQQ